MPKLVFEEVESNSDNVCRAKTTFGWLVCMSTDTYHLPTAVHDGGSGWDWRIALTFVFDPFHRWR